MAMPKLTYLANVYKQTNISEDAFKELSASWSGMSLPDLDKEISRIQPLINSEHSAAAAAHETKKPLAPSSNPLEFTASASKKDDELSKIDSMDSVDLFNKRGPYN